MHFDWWTLALQTINFAVLVWLLHRFLYKPVLRMVDARRAEVEKQYADAAEAEAKEKAALAQIEAERAKTAAEREATLKSAAAAAEEAAKARRTQAEREAAAILDAGRKTLATEREQALAEARRAALDLGAGVAHRLLDEVPLAVRAEAWLERISQSLAALPEAERQILLKQVSDGTPLTVSTASPLPPDAMEAWRNRLKQALSGGAVISFKVDSSLLAGAELHFPSAILSFSWQSALASLRAEIEGNGNPR